MRREKQKCCRSNLRPLKPGYCEDSAEQIEESQESRCGKEEQIAKESEEGLQVEGDEEAVEGCEVTQVEEREEEIDA